MQMVLNCIILGEDPPGFDTLEQCINNSPYLYLANRYPSLHDAAPLLYTRQIHLLLIGTGVPEMKHVTPEHHADLDQCLQILVLSYPTNRPEPFVVYSLHIIRPPFTPKHFAAITHELYQLIIKEGTMTNEHYYDDHFMVKSGNRHEKIKYEDLQYVEVMDDNIILHTINHKIVTAEKLDWIMAQLPIGSFMRVHRWFVVGFRHITELGNDYALIGNARIPMAAHISGEVAKRYRKER